MDTPPDYNLILIKEIMDGEEYIFVFIVNISNELQSRIKNLDSFINSIDEIILISDKDGNVLFSNDALTDKLGYEKEEIKRMHILSLHPEEVRKEAEDIYADMFLRKRNICPLPMQKKNGQYIPAETRVWFVDLDGKERLFSISKDLTHEQEALQKFTKLFDRNPACMAIMSLSTGKFTQVNNSVLKTLGFSEHEIIGKTSIEMNVITDVKEYEKAHSELLSQGFINEMVLKIRKKNGDAITGLFSAEIMVSQCEKFILIVMIDLSTQKEIEHELIRKSELQEILIDLSSRYINCSLENIEEEIKYSLEKVGRFVGADRVYIFDYNFNAGTTSNTFEWCNDTIEPQIEYLQDIPLESIPDWVTAHVKGHHIIIKDVSSLDGEISTVKEILEAQHVKSLVTIPMMFEDKCLGFIGFDSVKKHRIYIKSEIDLLQFYTRILANIYIRKAREDELRIAKANAEKANEAKNQFIAKTSHELRNPLNGAWGFLNLLNESINSGKEKEYVRNSVKSLSNAIRIANDLLDIARIETNELKLNESSVNIRNLIEESVTPYMHEINKQQVRLKLKINKSIPQNLISDFNRLKQIIGNLLNNAIIHSGADTIEIGCKVNKQEQNHVELLFYVKDNGVGISEIDRDHIFDFFYKKENSAAGAGLGLPICREIIGKMGGKLWIKSIENRGATFFFSLPVRKEKKKHIIKTDYTKMIQRLSVLNILIAEDDTINRVLLMEILTKRGIMATALSNGEEVLHALKTGNYDLILMDIQMPVMDGLEATKKIRKSNNPIPIIALTAAILPEEKKQYLDCGVNGIVEKPIFVDSLIKEICSVLDNNTVC